MKWSQDTRLWEGRKPPFLSKFPALMPPTSTSHCHPPNLSLEGIFLLVALVLFCFLTSSHHSERLLDLPSMSQPTCPQGLVTASGLRYPVPSHCKVFESLPPSSLATPTVTVGMGTSLPCYISPSLCVLIISPLTHSLL